MARKKPITKLKARKKPQKKTVYQRKPKKTKAIKTPFYTVFLKKVAQKSNDVAQNSSVAAQTALQTTQKTINTLNKTAKNAATATTGAITTTASRTANSVTKTAAKTTLAVKKGLSSLTILGTSKAKTKGKAASKDAAIARATAKNSKKNQKNKVQTIKLKKKSGVIYSHEPSLNQRLSTSIASVSIAARQNWLAATTELRDIFGLPQPNRKPAKKLKAVVPAKPSKVAQSKTTATKKSKKTTSKVSLAFSSATASIVASWQNLVTAWTSVITQIRRATKFINQKIWSPIKRTLSWFFRPLRPAARVLGTYPVRIALSLTLTILIIAGSTWIYFFVFKDLPSVQDLAEREQPMTTKILDRNGVVLFRIYKDENRTLIPLSQVPQHMIYATIAIEDKDFYSHHGFSIRGITRALIANSKGETVQGGSTITQQLVKNRLLTPEKTLQRKIKEIVLAILVDQTYTKQEILEMYFNEVAYGGSTYGVEEAAHRYFDKSAHDLTLGESALLAGLPQAPSAYTPFGSTPELAYGRQEEVLRRMVEDEYITPEQADAAKKEVLVFRTDRVDIRAPHFVMYIKKLLAELYGEEMVNEGGLEVRTSLDIGLQDEAQKVVTEELEKLARLRINNGAALVTNPKTGEVLAMVGSKNYFDFEHDGQVNVTLRPRQPGSSIKPLTYAVAFERGKNPSTVEDDAPITYHIPGSRPYSPKNYDGRFHGRVTLRESLGSSYNIPAVKLLAWVGLDNVINKGQQMGITTWGDRRRFGLSLTLGGGEVLMIDMAKLYGTFANQGYTVDTNPLLEVKNHKGEIIYINDCVKTGECPRSKTLDTRVAYQITNVLSDNGARTPAFGPRSDLVIPNQEVAVKTGTTNNLRDNWTIGYTTDRLVAVWVGNNDNTPMSYVASGVTGASPIWNKIIRSMLDDANPHHFAGPEGMIKVQICARTGTLTCRGCPAVRDEYYVPGTEPTQACNPAQFAPRPKATAQPQTDPNREKILDGVFTN
jgi:penicillin-binding protein 1C